MPDCFQGWMDLPWQQPSQSPKAWNNANNVRRPWFKMELTATNDSRSYLIMTITVSNKQIKVGKLKQAKPARRIYRNSS